MPHFFIAVLRTECLRAGREGLTSLCGHGQVQQQIKKSSAVKRTVVRLFFAVGTAYIRARRILDGVALEYARTAPSMFRVMLATLTAAILYPLYRPALLWAPHTPIASLSSSSSPRHESFAGRLN